MKKAVILNILVICTHLCQAEELVGIHTDNMGLVTKILPFHQDPTLGNGLAEGCSEDIAIEESPQFSVEVQNLKKDPTQREMEEARLDSLPEMSIPIKNTPLHCAIKLCAEACNMNYVAPAEAVFAEPVTLKVRANPYQILKMLADHHSLGMEFERGMWQFYRVNENELITRNYKLLYNNQEIVQKTPPSINKTLNSSQSCLTGCGVGDSGVFSIDTNVVVNEVQKILDLPTTGLEAVFADGGSVNGFAQIQAPSIEGAFKDCVSPGGKVIYISDNNELMVVGTRQQHSYIEKYLAAVDKPQRLIKIDAKFVETSRDPKTEMGIDWSGVSGGRLSLKGAGGDLSTGSWPSAALLSASDLSLQFNLIHTDSCSTVVQDPQVVTANNRKVSLKSVVQEPVESASNNIVTSGTNNSTSTIDYLEIGTIIDVFPQILSGSVAGYDEESVQLNLSIVVSSVVGEKMIRGNPFPVVSTRSYDYTVVVPSGYTLAIGGLSETNSTTSQTRVPVLGSLPIVGGLFKNTQQKQLNRNLVAYITPRILEDG